MSLRDGERLGSRRHSSSRAFAGPLECGGRHRSGFVAATVRLAAAGVFEAKRWRGMAFHSRRFAAVPAQRHCLRAADKALRDSPQPTAALKQWHTPARRFRLVAQAGPPCPIVRNEFRTPFVKRSAGFTSQGFPKIPGM